MKKRILSALLITILGLGTVLTGCGASSSGGGKMEVASSDAGPQSTSLVMGAHDNFPRISLNTESVYASIYNSCYTWGDVSGVVVDGKPFVACNYSISEPDKKIDNAKRKQLASNNTAQILAELAAASAKTPEIDTLSAITLSADTLHSVTGESDKTMIVFDSGLSTTSLLNFAAQNIIDEPVDSIVSQLEAFHAIPDLTDIEVVWVGLGATCGEQDDLTSSYKYKLQSIWEGILAAGGAKSVTFDKSPVSDEEPDPGLPQCSTVAVVADCLDVAANVTEEEMPEVIKWDENSPICFQGDKAEFVDEASAIKAMTPIAEYLLANEDEPVYIFGMTATITGGDSGVDLAQARADACKEVLEGLGVESDRIITIGLGQYDNPLRVKDVDENGKQLAEQAPKNRAVFLVRADSKMVGVLMGCIPGMV